MPKAQTISARVDEAFADENTAELSYAATFLGRLVTNMDELEAHMRRTTIATVALIAIFFLFGHSKSSEISLGFVKLTDVNGVLLLIPAIVAYLFCELVASATTRGINRRLMRRVINRLYPKLYETNLDSALVGVTTEAFGEPPHKELLADRSKGVARLRSGLDSVLIAAVILGPIAFLLYAYITLAERHHVNIAAITASALFSGLNLARGVLEFLEPEAK
ncbi:MAG: hypothetical protein ACTHMY_22475 [Solirubrobacteraceae bacterium]